MKTSYAPAEHWDQYHAKNHQLGEDLDWGNQWTGAFSRSQSPDWERTCGANSDCGLIETEFQSNCVPKQSLGTRPETGKPFKQVWRGIACR